MKLCLLLLVFSSVSASCCSQPEKNQLAFVAPINDSTQVEVYLHYNHAGEAQHYFGHVNTAVCEDGLCRLLVIDVFWDLLGNFLRYELPPGEALTKLDHKEFSDEDHKQLQAILSNKASILRDYPLEDLIVRQPARNSGNVDAVTAATRVDVRDAVVSGAVYSTYVLWHVINGTIASSIEAYSKPFLTQERVARMFYSDNFYYQYFALNSIAPADSIKYVDKVVHLVKNGKDYIPYFAIEKIPATVWQDEKYQAALLSDFGAADFELQNAMLNHISRVKLGERPLDILVGALAKLTDRQALKALDIIAMNKDRLSDESRIVLSKFSGRGDAQVSQQVKALLRNNTRNR